MKQILLFVAVFTIAYVGWAEFGPYYGSIPTPWSVQLRLQVVDPLGYKERLTPAYLSADGMQVLVYGKRYDLPKPLTRQQLEDWVSVSWKRVNSEFLLTSYQFTIETGEPQIFLGEPGTWALQLGN